MLTLSQRLRRGFPDGTATTVHVARMRRSRYAARVVAISPPAPLLEWCLSNDVDDAIVGGFFIRKEGTPLGELRIDGKPVKSESFEAPWNAQRACVQIEAGQVKLASPSRIEPNPGGDLLQAGPMLVRDGERAIEPGADPEGFSAGAAQFDSDITEGRYPRAALGLSRDDLIVVACDGRSDDEAGMTLAEMAATMVDLGSTEAINLDGGGSTSLVIGGELLNDPREEHGEPLGGGRPVSTAICFARL